MANDNAEAVPVSDEDGIMMSDYGGSIGQVYNPKVVAAAGLKYYQAYQLTDDHQVRQRFLNTADWLLAHSTDRGEYSIWEYDFAWKSYGGVGPPYTSALAQAEGISVLIKAHNLTGNDRYLVEARRAFGAFMTEYGSGGVASDEGRDSAFLQLLAKPGFQKTYVLNGHTNSLIFIWQYYEYRNDYRALIVFGKGINWLVSNLQKYDTGDWSYYDQIGNRARDNYHGAHIRQLATLYEITGEPLLKEYSEKFAGYAATRLIMRSTDT
ncbi:MAG TPA: D-glucuronyl C5-epimerase family protein [Nitrososphaera sp.]|nr:D-glucuronyl C5-epimerase family protein [Nitrososphaera sp.]